MPTYILALYKSQIIIIIITYPILESNIVAVIFKAPLHLNSLMSRLQLLLWTDSLVLIAVTNFAIGLSFCNSAPVSCLVLMLPTWVPEPASVSWLKLLMFVCIPMNPSAAWYFSYPPVENLGLFLTLHVSCFYWPSIFKLHCFYWFLLLKQCLTP